MKPPVQPDPYADKRATYALVWYIVGSIVLALVCSLLVPTTPGAAWYDISLPVPILVLCLIAWAAVNSHGMLTLSDFGRRTLIGYDQVIDQIKPETAKSRIERRDLRQPNDGTYALYVKLGGGWWPWQTEQVRIGNFSTTLHTLVWYDKHQLTIVPTNPEAHSFHVTDSSGDRLTLMSHELLWYMNTVFDLSRVALLGAVVARMRHDLACANTKLDRAGAEIARVTQLNTANLTACHGLWATVQDRLDECIKITNRSREYTSLRIAREKLDELGRKLNVVYSRTVNGLLGRGA